MKTVDPEAFVCMFIALNLKRRYVKAWSFSSCTLALISMLIASEAGFAQVSSDAEFAFLAADGPVRTAFETNGVLYIGGDFRQIGPFTGGFVPVSPSSGNALAPVPYVMGSVNCSVPDAQGGVYFGGSFKAIGSLSATNVGHLTTDGAVDSGFSLSLDGDVLALALYGSKLFVGGNFLTVNGESHAHLAAIDIVSHQVTSFSADIDGSVRALAISGDTLFVGGAFNTAGGAARRSLASINLTSETVTSWNPTPDSPYPLAVGVLLADDGRIYAAGDFTQIDAVPHNAVAAFDAATGALLAWNPQVNSGGATFIFALAIASNTVYIAGSFESIAGQPRTQLAAVDKITGNALPWAPYIPYNRVYALAVSENTVYIGGDFPSVGTNGPQRLAAVDAISGQPSSWTPLPAGSVSSLLYVNGRVYVGGSFSVLGGVNRTFVAVIDLATGLPTSWDAHLEGYYVSSTVSAMSVSSNVLFLGGNFHLIAGQARSSLGAVNLTDGSVLPFHPNLSGAFSPTVVGMKVAGTNMVITGFLPTGSPTVFDTVAGQRVTWNFGTDAGINSFAANGGTLYIGGAFTHVNGQSRSRLAAYDSNTRQLLPWNPTVNGSVTGVFLRDQQVIALGSFSSANGQARNHIAAFDAITGDLGLGPTNLDVYNQVRSVTASSSALYVAGDFSVINGATRTYFAALTPLTGQVMDWDAAVLPRTDGPPGGYVVVALTDRIVIGGYFYGMAGTPRTGLAAFPITNRPPAVQILSPTNNTIIPAPAQLPLQVTTTSSALDRVDVYVKTDLLLSTTNAFLSTNWVLPKHIGDYVVTAVAYDRSGQTALSPAARVSVVLPLDYIVPTLSILSPSNNTTYPPFATIVAQPSIVAPKSAIEQVQFLLNSNVVATLTNPPYSVTFSNMVPRTNTLTVWLQDEFGVRVTNGPVTFKINKAPQVTLLKPSNGTIGGSPTDLAFQVNASDTDGFIRSVTFLTEGTVIGIATNSPFSFTFSNAPPGYYAFQAVATDDFGSTATSAVANVTLYPLPAYDLILDNTSSNATFSALWATGTVASVRFGSDYRFVGSVTGAPTVVATYTPVIPASGLYDVFVWYPNQSPSAATNTQWTIHYDGGTTNVSVNQAVNSGQWALLASELGFTAGVNGFVSLANNTGEDSNHLVTADAVRFSSSTAPFVLTQPSNRSAKAGATVTFSVSANGSPPLFYQWHLFDTNLPGASGSSITLTAIGLSNAGPYSVLVTNAVASAPSSNAILTVLPPSSPALSSGSVQAGDFRFTMTGDSGVVFAIESSTNLIDWLSLTNFVNTSGSKTISDSVTNAPYRFFRARWLPF